MTFPFPLTFDKLKRMKKLALIVGLLTLFLSTTMWVEAAGCGPVLPGSNTCPVFGERTIFCAVPLKPLEFPPVCCSTQKDCDAYKAQRIQMKQIKVCDLVPKEKRDACTNCFEKDPPEAWTAIGCIPTTPSGFISEFLNLGIGIAGGIAFLLILFSGFQMLTSTGNPEKLNAGKELLTSAISGLILIIFSLFLLRLIGWDILGLPDFGK